MKIYKLRNKKTGKFFSRVSYNRIIWHKAKGKTWVSERNFRESLGVIKANLARTSRYYAIDPANIEFVPEDLELVEFEVQYVEKKTIAL